MTITNVSRIDVDGNDAATVFSFSPMIIFAASDLLVTHVSAAGVETILAEGTGATNYSISAIDYPGTGSITYPADTVTPLPTGESLVIQRDIPLTQSVSLGNQSAYNAKVQEHLFDRVTAMIQDLDDRVEVLPAVPAGGLTPGTVPVVNAEGDGFDYVLGLVGDAGAVGPAGPAGVPVFYGALVGLTATLGPADLDGAVSWTTALLDTGYGGTDFWAGGAPTRLTVPAGVTKVRLSANLWTNAVSAESVAFVSIKKNGSNFKGMAVQNHSADNTDPAHSILTPVLEVEADDYFEVNLAYTDSSYELISHSTFGIEVVEVSEATTPPIYIDQFTAGTLAASQIVLRYTFATATTILEDFAGSVTNSSATATAAAAFSIQKNGSPIGTMDFAMSADDATFSVTGDQSFVAGDILSITAPASPDATLANVAITILGTATAS